MTVMNRFTHDLETAELSAGECASYYAGLVGYLCKRFQQRNLSCVLAEVTRPQADSLATLAERAAQRMWREEAVL